jgi:hypothetical protein
MTNEIATYKPSAMALALKSDRVIDLPENIAKSKLMDIVSKTEFELGYKPSDAKQMAMTCNLLLEEIKTEFKAIRIDELPIAFKKGARGEYGEFFGLSVVTFNKWLNAYQISEQRRDALKSIRDAEPVTIKHPSKAEALKMFLEMWVRRYTEYKKSGVIKFDTPFRDYRILWENGLINHDQSEREMFIEQTLDSRIEEALPILARLTGKQHQMKEADEFESWTRAVTEGTWATPDTPQAENDLKLLLSKPFPVGPNATYATEKLYDLLGDDQLFDQLAELADQDPDADARPLIQARLEELDIDIAMPAAEVPEPAEPAAAQTPPEEPVQAENLDVDGVMMTKPSNMSSESVERILRLAQLLK